MNLQIHNPNQHWKLMEISKFIASRSFLSFKKSYTRSILRLSIIATTLSLSVMIISQSVYSGFQKEIARKVFGFWGNIHITDIKAPRSIEPVFITLSQSLLDSIRDFHLPGEEQTAIRHVQKFIYYPSIISTQNEFEGLFLKGVGKDFDWNFFQNFLLKGSIINTKDSVNRDILISEQTASRLRLDTGQHIILNFIVNEQPLKRKMKVVGIYNTGLVEYDRKFALIDMINLQRILKVDTSEVTGLEVFCTDLLKSDQINTYLYEDLLPASWSSETIREKFPSIFEWLSLQDLSSNFILLLILCVCIINMSTTTMILIFERTHMIGVLTVLGMKRWMQRKIFLRYAARILLKSMLAGNLIGIGLCLAQDRFKIITLNESDYYLSYAPIDLSGSAILLLNILFFTIIILFLLLPTWIVQSIRPVQALKFR